MKTGSRGTFVISWSQTETDGVPGAPLDMLTVGAAWRWTGVPVRVDGPQNVLVLEQAEGAADLRRRAARMVRRLIGASLGRPVAADQHGGAEAAPEQDMAEPEQGFIVILVTHDLRESVFLADTLYVMSKSPGRFVVKREIDLPRPRELELTYTKEFTDVVLELRGHIGSIRGGASAAANAPATAH